MESSAIESNSLLNAAAVWFIFKAIEVIVFVVYDTFTAIKRWVRNWRWRDRDPNPSEVPYDPTRVRLEYVMSGAGFLDLSFCCRKRRPLLLIICILSTVIPLGVFVLELFSIVLGNNRRDCETSTDLNVVSSPSLVLFGEGERHGNLSTTLDEVGYGGAKGIIRPCISWPSNHAGVDYLSSMCASIATSANHFALSENEELFPLRPEIGVLLAKAPHRIYEYQMPVFAIPPSSSSLNLTFLGNMRIYSEVVVNGKHILYQNATYTEVIKEATLNQLREDVRTFEELDSKGRAKGVYVENESVFGFIWPDADSYIVGVKGLVFALFAQSTRDAVKPAAEMSYFNSFGMESKSFEISCSEDFLLPRSTSIAIIVVAVVFRLILTFIPTPKSSVEMVLNGSDDRQSNGVEIS